MNGCFNQLYLKLTCELGYIDPNKPPLSLSSSSSTTPLLTSPLNSPLMRSPFASFSGLSLSYKKPTQQEFLDGIQPIFKMLDHKDSTVESRIQAAKMLCDLSTKNNSYLEIDAFRIPCMKRLAILVNDEDADVRQYAVMAIKAFAELPCYLEPILHSCILVALFELLEHTPTAQEAYATAQIRRTAASLLATLSKSHPYTVKEGLERQDCNVEKWLKTVPGIADLRTRESALIISSALADVPSINSSLNGGDYLIDSDLLLPTASNNLIL